RRLSTHGLLRPADLAPTRTDFEVIGTFNPGAIRGDDEILLLARVAERPREPREGLAGLPRWDRHAGFTIDWVPMEELDEIDARVVRCKADGRLRLTSISHLRV